MQGTGCIVHWWERDPTGEVATVYLTTQHTDTTDWLTRIPRAITAPVLQLCVFVSIASHSRVTLLVDLSSRLVIRVIVKPFRLLQSSHDWHRSTRGGVVTRIE